MSSGSLLRRLLPLLTLLGGAACADSRPPEVYAAASATFRPGQVWAYQARPHERRSRVLVLRVDSAAGIGTIVHVRVSGLQIRSPQTPVPIEEIGHIPFREETLQRSVTRLVREGEPLPEFAEGYDQWRRAGREGGLGVFTVSVAEAVEVAEATMTGGSGISEQRRKR